MYLYDTLPTKEMLTPTSLSQGHLQLLKHTFLHGVHDLNVIAAIILPRTDKSVQKKCESAGGTFMFGMEERCTLWEQDPAFPPWAWVYRDTTKSFSGFKERLKQAAKKDSFDIDFVMLYGPEIGSPDDPPTSVYGCEIIIMSDAARQASFQRSNGRIADFQHCTRWKRVTVDRDQLEHYARAKAHRAMLRMSMRSICLNETESMPKTG